MLKAMNGKTGKESHVQKDFWLDLTTSEKDLWEGLREEAEKDKANFMQHFVRLLAFGMELARTPP